MKPNPTPTSAAEINRLHAEAKQCARASREALHAALAAAWQAGHLLTAEKKQVIHRMGQGAWLHWLEANFRGSARTAQRYMKLSQSVTDVAFLRGMSLRQAYARLGIATEPHQAAERRLRHRLPAHLTLANRLVRALRRRPGQTLDQQAEAYRRDLRMLYDKLRPWFETPPTGPKPVNFPARKRSDQS